jgi:hypothetical protein
MYKSWTVLVNKKLHVHRISMLKGFWQGTTANDTRAFFALLCLLSRGQRCGKVAGDCTADPESCRRGSPR